jgi:hypothetical protein
MPVIDVHGRIITAPPNGSICSLARSNQFCIGQQAVLGDPRSMLVNCDLGGAFSGVGGFVDFLNNMDSLEPS